LPVLILVLLFSGFSNKVRAQHNVPPKIFLNCSAECYSDYVRSEITFFNFVRDRYAADIEVFINGLSNGSGGFEYTLTFQGKNTFANLSDTLKFSTRQADTEDIVRKKMVRNIKMGLARTLMNTNLFSSVLIDFPKGFENEEEEPSDKWDYWVFRIGGRGSFRSESNKKNSSIRTDLGISRVTNESKFSVYTYHNQYFDRYMVDSAEVTARNTNYGVSGLFVKSFSERWAAGGFYRGYHSVYSNIAFSQSLAPAVEYSMYPISEVMRHQMRWIYQVGLRNLSYIETTIYDKNQETLPYHQLTGIMRITQPWGAFSAELSGYQYLHDLKKNRLSLEVDLNWRITQGLSVWLNSDFSLINNQISLAKSEGEASQILLNNRQLPTNFRFSSSFGMSYTFGSLNNNIINPRFSGVN
jgi:hypothetical protein